MDSDVQLLAKRIDRLSTKIETLSEAAAAQTAQLKVTLPHLVSQAEMERSIASCREEHAGSSKVVSQARARVWVAIAAAIGTLATALAGALGSML